MAEHTLTLEKVATEEATYKRKTVRLPEYRVLLDGKTVGRVRRAMVTRERRTPGRRYVNARWKSPGWVYTREDRRYGRSWSAENRRDAIERLLGDTGVHWTEARTLATTVEKVR